MYFQYISVADMRAEGLTSASISDEDLKKRIRLASQMINSFTDQWFIPIYQEYNIDGYDYEDLIKFKNLIPIVSISEVNLASVVEGGVSYEDITEDIYVYNRYIRHESTQFGSGKQNVQVKGYFGWIDSKTRVETTTAGDLEAGDTELVLTSVDGLQIRDVLLIENSTQSTYVLIDEIDTGTNTITFDAIDSDFETIASGADAFTYGKVPQDIAHVTAFLTNDIYAGLATAGASSIHASMIKKEKTDNYSYELFDSSEGAGGSSGGARRFGGFTGNPWYDMILSNYTVPPDVTAV